MEVYPVTIGMRSLDYVASSLDFGEYIHADYRAVRRLAYGEVSDLITASSRT